MTYGVLFACIILKLLSDGTMSDARKAAISSVRVSFISRQVDRHINVCFNQSVFHFLITITCVTTFELLYVKVGSDSKL